MPPQICMLLPIAQERFSAKRYIHELIISVLFPSDISKISPTMKQLMVMLQYILLIYSQACRYQWDIKWSPTMIWSSMILPAAHCGWADMKSSRWQHLLTLSCEDCHSDSLAPACHQVDCQIDKHLRIASHLQELQFWSNKAWPAPQVDAKMCVLACRSANTQPDSLAHHQGFSWLGQGNV